MSETPEPRTLTEEEVGTERYNTLGRVSWSETKPNHWTDEDKAKAWTTRGGDVVEFDGYLYAIEGYDYIRHENGEQVPTGNWSPYRLPRSHFYVRGGSHTADHVNEGEGLPTKAKALALAKKDAARRTLADGAWQRNPPAVGPVPFSTEVEIRELEPGYWECSAFGHRWRRWNPDKPKEAREYPAGAEINADGQQPWGELYSNANWDYQNWLKRGEGLSALLRPKTICLLGTTRPDTDCALCEPGSAWGKHKVAKVRIGIHGFGGVEEVLCLHHMRGYLLPWRLQHLAYQVIDGPSSQWEERLNEWVHQAAVAAEEGRSYVDLKTRWMAYLRSEKTKKKEQELVRAREAAAVAKAARPTGIGAGVELSKDGRTVSYGGKAYRVVRDGALWAARDGRRAVCDYLPKAAFVRAVKAHVEAESVQGELFGAAG